MEIPYTVTARPDTGLWNAKIGIWLFLASEVMLFGGLFSAYVFLRMGADYPWPEQVLDIKFGFANTIILILSSVFVVFAWAALKMRKWKTYKFTMTLVVACAVLFLINKSFEYKAKFHHYSVELIDGSVLEGHVHHHDHADHHSDGDHHSEEDHGKHAAPAVSETGGATGESDYLELAVDNVDLRKFANPPYGREKGQVLNSQAYKYFEDAGQADIFHRLSSKAEAGQIAYEEAKQEWVEKHPGKKIREPKFHDFNMLKLPKDEHPTVQIPVEEIAFQSNFTPKLNPYYAIYFTMTGLHGLHVFGGALVLLIFLVKGRELYLKNPEHLANRVEVAGLFWHFVDLVWIFLFPIFYLL